MSLEARPRKRHWTVYAVILLSLVSIAAVSYIYWLNEKIANFEDAITEAGGIVRYNDNGTTWPINIGSRSYYAIPHSPASVEFISGSHPIPKEIHEIRSFASIKYLILNTSPVGDHLVPAITRFKQLNYLDLKHTYVTAGGIQIILEALPNLKEFHVSTGEIRPEDLSKLKTHPRASILRFH